MHDHLTASALTNMGAGIGTAVFAMTDAVSIAIVGAVASVATGIATVFFAYKAKVMSTEAKDISAQTHQAVNGKMEEFKKMAEAFYHAKGVADEKVSAEVKAGSEAIAKAIGKAEGKAEVVAGILTEKLQTVAAAPTVTAPAPASPTRMGEAITELKDAAEETSVSADKTVDIVDKLPPHK